MSQQKRNLIGRTKYERFEVIAAVPMQITTFRAVTPSILADFYLLSEKLTASIFRVGRPGKQTASKISGGTAPDILFSTSSRQPLIKWVPGEFPPGGNGRGVKLTTHQLVPRSRIYIYIRIYTKHMRE
jgi:hypothetical protein